MASSNRWILGAILLLPGLFIAFSLQLFGQSSESSAVPSSLNVNQMPPTSAGGAEPFYKDQTSKDQNSEWGISLSSSAVSTKQLIELAGMTGQVSVQLPKYRFRRDEKILSRVSFDLKSGRLPDGFEMTVALVTQQGNMIRDVTPNWSMSSGRIHGLISVVSEADWPENLELDAIIKAPQQLAHETKVQLELFSPKILVTGVSPPYLDGDDWLIPVEITVNEPGVAVVSARLTEDNGTLVTHLQSRSRLTKSGTLLMHVRSQLISDHHFKQNLMLTDITVRHIADGLNAKLGWGDTSRDRYVIPTLDESRKP
jgi:hypothetical protein